MESEATPSRSPVERILALWKTIPVSLRWALTLALAICPGMLTETMLSDDGWPRHRRLERDIATVQSDNERMRVELGTMRRKIDAVKGHKGLQQRLVRDRLDYAGPDDIIITLPND